MWTVNDILLSRKIGQLGESGYNSTFRPAFITKQQETDFNSKLQQHSVVKLLQDARTRASFQNPDNVGMTHYLIDQLESSDIPDSTKKQFLICMINEFEDQ